VAGSTTRTILVALERSDLAAAALLPAVQLARATDARVILLQVVPERGPEARAACEAERDAAERSLCAAADRLRRAGIPSVVATCAGDPATSIARGAALWRAEIIVLAAHRPSVLGRLLHGSVATGVVRAAAAPVMVVPVRDGARPSLGGGAVLAVADGSPADEDVVGHAAALAAMLSRPVSVVHPVWWCAAPVGEALPPDEALHGLLTEARVRADLLAHAARRSGVPAWGAAVAGPPANVALECAEVCGAAAIVVPDRPSPVLDRLGFAGLLDAVLSRTSRPVLVARPGAWAPRILSAPANGARPLAAAVDGAA
jgi:nucleotide-binding universal stress UspA family protein